MSGGPSLLQEERDFQSELDTLTVDDHRVRVQQDIDDFVTGSPRRSVSRNRESGSPERAQSPTTWGNKEKGNSRPAAESKKREETSKSPEKESQPARTASPIASLFGSLTVCSDYYL